MAQTKQVTKKEQADLATKEFYSQDYTGLENLKTDELQVPFLRIAQAMTKQAQKRSESYIQGLELGDFYGVPSDKAYGPEVNVILLGRFTNYLEKEDKQGTEIKGIWTEEEFQDQKSTNTLTQDGLDWYTPEGNYLLEMKNFFVMLADHPEDGVMILSLKKGGIKHYRKWMTKAAMQQIELPNGKKAKARLFDVIWTVKSIEDKNDEGSWYAIGTKQVFTPKVKSQLTQDLFAPVMENLELVKSYIENLGKIKFDHAVDGEDEQDAVEL